MKYKLRRFLFILGSFLILNSFFLIPASFAATPLAPGAVTLADLGSDSQTAILPTNPFYSVSSWFRKVFSGTKLIDQLTVLNQKAAEVHTAKTVAPEHLELMTRSLHQYQNATFSVFSKMKKIKVSDLGEVGSLEASQNRATIAATLLINLRFSDDLAGATLTSSEQSLIEDIQKTLNNTLTLFLTRFESSDALGAQLMSIADAVNSPYVLLRLQETLINVVLNADSASRSALAPLWPVIDVLTTRLAGRLEAEAIAPFPQVFLNDLVEISGTTLVRLRSVIVLIERVTNPEIKSKLNMARSQLETIAEIRNLVRIQELEARLREARETLAVFENIVNSQGIVLFPAVSQIRTRARFNVEQAEVLAGLSNKLGAYSQALLSIAASRMGMLQLPQEAAAYEDSLETLRLRYDEISALASVRFTDETGMSKAIVAAALSETAKQISEVAARIATQRDFSAIPVNLYNLELRLATLRALVSE